MAVAAPGSAAICRLGRQFFFQPDHMGRRGIRVERERRDGGNRENRYEKQREKAAADRLTEWTKAFNLNMLNRSCPELGKVLRFVFVGSWYFRVCKHKPRNPCDPSHHAPLLGGRPIGRTPDSEFSKDPPFSRRESVQRCSMKASLSLGCDHEAPHM